jgi:hypothetical protein
MQYTSAFAEIEEEFMERVYSMVWCNLASVDEQQRPRSRIVHPFWEGKTGWLTTGPATAKARQLAARPFISLAYIADQWKPVYVECRVAWQNDPATRQHVWELFRQTPEPMGGDLSMVWGHVDNSAYGILRLEPWRIELYDLFHQDNRKIWQSPGA